MGSLAHLRRRNKWGPYQRERYRRKMQRRRSGRLYNWQPW